MPEKIAAPDEADQVELAIFSAEMIAQDPPAQLRDQTRFAGDAELARLHQPRELFHLRAF